MEGRPHAVDAMLSGDIQLVFNTAKGAGAIKDSFSLRHTALTNKVPYYTTVAGSRAAAEAIRALRAGHGASALCRIILQILVDRR